MYTTQQQYGIDYFYREQTNDRYLTTENLLYYFFNFRGRISRSEYWFATIFIWIMTFIISSFTILITAMIVGAALSLNTEAGIISFFWQLGAGLIFLGGFALAGTVASYMLAIKRAHDRNRPGWFVLLYFVPIANIWIFIELAFLRGTDGDNPYGNDPRLRFSSQSPTGYRPAFAPDAQDFGDIPAQRVHRYAETSPTTFATSQRTMPSGMPGSGLTTGPVLVAMSGEYAGSKIPIDTKGILIGRDPEHCNLVMASKDISRMHARITCLHSEKKFLIEDLQSKNGIYIGRERIHSKTIISSGESFTLSEDAATFMVNFV